jgi:hypothetical protein
VGVSRAEVVMEGAADDTLADGEGRRADTRWWTRRDSESTDQAGGFETSVRGNRKF